MPYNNIKLTNKFVRKLFSSNWFLFLSVFFAGSIFRLPNLDLIEFKTDEAVNLLLAARPIFGHAFAPGSTVSSVGVLNPPFLNYLLFPLTLLSLDPRVVTFFIALTNTLAIGFFVLIIKKYHNNIVAYIAGLLIAFSPWMIIYSRKIWTQDLIFPFFVPFLFSLYKVAIDKDEKYWLVFSLFSAFLIQLHQTSLFFIFLIFLFLIINKTKINFKYLISGLIVGFIPFVPYLFYQANNGCPDCTAIITAKDRISSFYQFSIFARPFQILGKGNFQTLLGADTLTIAQKYPWIYKLEKLFYFEYLLLPLGIIIFLKENKRLKFMVLATFLLPVIYFFLKIEPLMHYLIIVSPLLFLFFSFGIYFLIKRIKFLGIFIFSLLIICSFFYNLIFFNILKNQKSLKGDYGTAFITTWKNTENKFSLYKGEKDYKEMFLTSFIPDDLVFGFQPVGNMVYSPKQITKQELANLDSLLEERPYDPRIKQKILSYYTINVPTKQTLKEIKSKLSIKKYDEIYKEVLELYYAKNYKKNYTSNNFGINIEIPQHWQVKEGNSGKDIFTVDNYSFSLNFAEDINNEYYSNFKQVSKAQVLGQETTKKTCTNQGKWCGTIYSPVKIKGRNIVIIYSIVDDKYPDINTKTTQGIIKSMDDVVANLEN